MEHKFSNIYILIVLCIFSIFNFKAFGNSSKVRGLTSYEIMKTIPHYKIDSELIRKKVGGFADWRTYTVGDFNNDGKVEILAWKQSKKYHNYLWKDNNFSKGNGYHQKGTKLSQDMSWQAKIVSFIHPGPSISNPSKNQSLEDWKINVVGDKGCVHPSQILPAYLNEDDLTDFVIVCTGYDGYPFSGEHSLIMLSNGKDNYTIGNLTKSKGYYHDGSTADFNNDGFMDIMLADTITSKLQVYINDGKGEFTKKNNYFPQFSSFKTYTTEILDINEDGFFDVFLGGHEVGGGTPTKILFGNKDNKFSTNNMKLIPNVKGFKNVLDVIKIKDNLFIIRTGSSPDYYKGASIQQVSIKTMKTVSVYKNENMEWIRRIFTLKADENFKVRYGSLLIKTKGLDFYFRDHEVKLLFKLEEAKMLEGLYKKVDGFYVLTGGLGSFIQQYPPIIKEVSKKEQRKVAAKLSVNGRLVVKDKPSEYIMTEIRFARIRLKETEDGILFYIGKDAHFTVQPLAKHQKRLYKKCGEISYFGDDKIFIVLKTDDEDRMIRQKCVYNYLKKSKDKNAFQLYHSFLQSAFSLGQYVKAKVKIEDN